MAVRKIGQRWYYDFRIRRSRYRGVIPEARTKAQAETAEVRIRNKIFDRKYNTQADTLTLAEFIDEVYLPYAKLNKRHPINDELHCKAIVEFFGKKTFALLTSRRFTVRDFGMESRCGRRERSIPIKATHPVSWFNLLELRHALRAIGTSL